LYDYAQKRIKERALAAKPHFLTTEEKFDLEKLLNEQYA